MKPSRRRRGWRALFYLVTLAVVFAAGFSLAWYGVVVRDAYRMDALDQKIQRLVQGIYGSNHFHIPQVDAEAQSKLAAFDPARGSNCIKLSYSSIWGSSSLTLQGNGSLISETKRGVRNFERIAPERCKAVFHKFLTSGLLNYSDEVVKLKGELIRELGPRRGMHRVDDGRWVEISITVPELQVDKAIRIYEPEVELKNFPDLIELSLFIAMEQELIRLAE
jgi:hypothetical protein